MSIKKYFILTTTVVYCNILQTKEWGERPMLLKVRRYTFELERPCFGYHFHLWWPVFLSLFSSSKALTSIGRSMYLTVKLRCKQKCQDFQTPFISTAVRLVKPTDILTLQTNKSALYGPISFTEHSYYQTIEKKKYFQSVQLSSPKKELE